MVDLGSFGSRALLTGAGLSKNWGGYLAGELWGCLLSHPRIASADDLRTILLRRTSFERALEDIRKERRDAQAFLAALRDVFDVHDRLLSSGDARRPSTMKFLKFALALPSLAAADKSGHVMLAPGDIKWGDAPPTLPAGAKLAVLYGDPGKEGLYVVRLRLPAGYRIAAHWHPVDENVTVLSGSFAMGMGDKLDAAKTKAFSAGSFLVMPGKMNHFALAKGETTVEVIGMGPFTLTYVNPDDDPTRNQAAKK